MSGRLTPITFVNNSLTSTNNSIVNLSTGVGHIFSSYASSFTTSNLTVANNFLMSNTTPATHQANFYSTVITVTRGDFMMSNPTVTINGNLEPDGIFGLSNTYFATSNAGITVVNNPYNPSVDYNAYTSNLNNYFLNTNLIVTTTDGGGGPEQGIRYGGIGFGCNTPSYPIDMTIDPTYTGAYHGAAIAINNGGIRINSDQNGQVAVTSLGDVAEARFDTTAIGGPLMKYGSGTSTRGGYIYAAAGDAINIAATGQVSICNAGLAQTTYSLYIGGNVGINGGLTFQNSEYAYMLMYSTSLNMYNGNIMVSNDIRGEMQVTNTNLNILSGDLYFNRLSTTTAHARFYSTNMVLFNGDFVMNNNTTQNADLYSTNMSIYNGSFTMNNNTTQNADFYSTNMTITNGNFTLCNTASVTATATFYSTQVTILNGGFIQSNTTGALATALFYSTAMTVHGPISTTETLYCLGRFNSPNVANISTLIVGNNIASTAKVSLDIVGSLRTGVQTFTNASGNIQVNGGNLIYGSNSNAATDLIMYIPETDGAEVGTYFTIHTDITNNAKIYLSTSGGDYINTTGTRSYQISKSSALTALFCYATGSWHAVTTG